MYGTHDGGMDLGCNCNSLLLFYILVSSLPKTLTVERKVTIEVTRQNIGDVFRTENMECSEESCIGLSSGTAATYKLQEHSRACGCRCHEHLPVYREDLRICVDDIHECVLAPFVGGSTVQKIPFVFLPLKGQIIHPSKEISFTGIETPVCAVSGAKYLTENGWMELRNVLDLDVPFRLYRDEGRTFLQWVGEPELRSRMAGRLVLVYLMCREVNQPSTQTTAQTLFSPCVAFRVVGSPKRNLLNISEVTFFPGAQSSTNNDSDDRLSVSEYVAIGICSVLLGLIYVASVLLYLHLRKRSRGMEKANIENRSTVSNEGIIKNNPLLSVSSHHYGPDALFSESNSSDNDMVPDLVQRHSERPVKTTSALIHPNQAESSRGYLRKDSCYQDQSNIEKLPEENVSIVETLENREGGSDNFKALTGSTRKKLYFNPAYFEPQLLLAPPPAAVEFLHKIREVINIAKQKMSMKKFAPTLMGIPEEEFRYPVEPAQEFASLRSSSRRSGSHVSLKRENSRRKTCSGCPGCDPQDFKHLSGRLPEFPSLGACGSCVSPTGSVSDNKQQSIRRWLENVPILSEYSHCGEGSSRGSQFRAPKRIRSPTRSLPPNGGSMSSRPLSPKPASETGAVGFSNRRLMSTNTLETHCLSEVSESGSNAKHSQDSSRQKQKEPMSLPPPDMIHEAMALDNRNDEEAEQEVRIPTITRKNMQAVINELHHQGQKSVLPDKPYESDSLENSKKEREGLHTPSDYAEVPSSQHSPSLSTALPMDEEMTMRNAVFSRHANDQATLKSNTENPRTECHSPDDDHDYELVVLRKDGRKMFQSLPELLQRSNDGCYSLVSEVYVNNGYNFNSAPSSPGDSPTSTMGKGRLRVRYEGQPGKLLIEVEDCPDNYIPVQDEETFEPDTLDRKPSNKPKTSTESEFIDSLERPQQILLRSSGSFRKEPLTPCPEHPESGEESSFTRTFGSLREIYEAKLRGALGTVVFKGKQGEFTVIYPNDSEGRLLTLEDRHCKRQRTDGDNNAVQPDVIPPPPRVESPIYQRPKPPRKIVSTSTKSTLTDDSSNQNQNMDSEYQTSPNNTEEIKNRNSLSPTTIDNQDCPNKTEQNPQDSNKPFHIDTFKPTTTEHLVMFAQTEHRVPSFRNMYPFKFRNFRPKNDRNETKKSFWQPLRSCYRLEDSGYLSTDSNESRKLPSKLDMDKDKPCGGSETEDSFGDGHSESGAESVETHSVFFDIFRHGGCNTASMDSGLVTDSRSRDHSVIFMDDNGQYHHHYYNEAYSDSESVSYTTVVPFGSNASTISSNNDTSMTKR